MRNAFVVLVFLCIGLVSGFIVPSSLPQDIVTKSFSNTDKSRDVKVKSTTLPPKKAVLPKSRSNIDEKDLYEHATEKKNNQSERAFVYINQKNNMKPIRSKIIKTLVHPDFAFALAHASTPAAPQPTVQSSGPSAFDSSPNFVNSKFGVYQMVDEHPHKIASYLAAPDTSLYKSEQNEDHKNKELTKVNMQWPDSQRGDERREYFELLKSPLIIPVNRKVLHDKVHDLSSLSPSIIPNIDNYIKKYSMKNQFTVQAQDAVSRQNVIPKNYGFNNAFMRRPDFQTKELSNKVQDSNFEDQFINSDGSRHHFTNNQDEDIFLDKYLKDTFEEMPLLDAHDKVRTYKPECATRDCTLEPFQKSFKNSGRLIKSDCSCERTPSVKQADPFVSRDRSLREEKDRQDTLPKSSETVYYEELLTEDSNMLKQEDGVVKPPSRLVSPSQ